MRRLLLGILILGLPVSLACPQAAFAKKRVENQGSIKKKPAEQGATHTRYAYLGVEVESLHPALVMHLPKTLVGGQGVLVARVAPNSPAAKAGIKQHDILITYKDQKLFSPEQLVKLVQADKPGGKVKLQVVREGKPESCTVTLGAAPRHSAPNQHAAAPWWERPWLREFPKYLLPGQRSQIKPKEGNTATASPWESFDSLTLKKLDNDRFRAEINYLGQDGQKCHHQFEGTREEIRSQIRSEKDLPATEREHLLRGLNLRDEPFMPDFWYGPQWRGELNVAPYPWYEWPDVSQDF